MSDPRRVRAVVQAWTVPGRRPDIHRAAQDKLKREWPTLAEAIEALVRDEQKRSTASGEAS